MTSRERTLKLLGLQPGATQDELKQRYRELARIFHPDVNTNDDRATGRFRAITAAYKELMSIEEAPILLTKRKGKDPPSTTAPAMTSRTAGGSPRFRVVSVDVTLAQVIAGARIKVVLPDGRLGFVEIPPGADTGTLVRHNGGDVLIEVRVAVDPSYRRRGADLLTQISISIEEAYRGTRVDLLTPSGPMTVVIPKRSRHGDVIRVVARGVPSPSGRGDLYVELSA